MSLTVNIEVSTEEDGVILSVGLEYEGRYHGYDVRNKQESREWILDLFGRDIVKNAPRPGSRYSDKDLRWAFFAEVEPDDEEAIDRMGQICEHVHEFETPQVLWAQEFSRPAQADLAKHFRAGIYLHFKGGLYTASGLAARAEDPDDLMVVYSPLTLDDTHIGPTTYVRYLTDFFLETFEGDDLRARFTYMGQMVTPSVLDAAATRRRKYGSRVEDDVPVASPS